MSLSEEKKVLLSQFVDGELPVDQANQVLADVLGELTHGTGDAEGAEQLQAMNQLRQALGPWRRQEPPKEIVTRRSAHAGGRSQLSWRVISLASAAMLGGILVGGGVFLGKLLTVPRLDTPIARQEPEARSGDVIQPVVVVSPEQRREIAGAFALHESVAGALSWYVDDDATIQVAPAEEGETMRRPIAIVLRLTRELSSSSGEAIAPKTCVVVCRNRDTATIELPRSAVWPSLRLRLFSTEANDRVKLQYVLAADGPVRGQEEAALIGLRYVGLGQTSLGQLAFSDHLVNVDASAWVLGNGAE
jgi:hypothetical protein